MNNKNNNTNNTTEDAVSDKITTIIDGIVLDEKGDGSSLLMSVPKPSISSPILTPILNVNEKALPIVDLDDALEPAIEAADRSHEKVKKKKTTIPLLLLPKEPFPQIYEVSIVTDKKEKTVATNQSTVAAVPSLPLPPATPPTPTPTPPPKSQDMSPKVSPKSPLTINTHMTSNNNLHDNVIKENGNSIENINININVHKSTPVLGTETNVAVEVEVKVEKKAPGSGPNSGNASNDGSASNSTSTSYKPPSVSSSMVMNCGSSFKHLQHQVRSLRHEQKYRPVDPDAAVAAQQNGALVYPNMHLEMLSLANSMSLHSLPHTSHSLAHRSVRELSLAQAMAGGTEQRQTSSTKRGTINTYIRDTPECEDCDIQQELLTDKAVTVIRRVMDKLTGLDFSDPSSLAAPAALDVPEQVDRLIIQATANENLCLSFLGWCPFW